MTCRNVDADRDLPLPPLRGKVGMAGSRWRSVDAKVVPKSGSGFRIRNPEPVFDPRVSALESFFGLKEDLEALFGRPVDLVMPDAVRNPYLRAEIARDRQLLYAA